MTHWNEDDRKGDQSVANWFIDAQAWTLGVILACQFALDAINGRFGKWTAVTASQGFRREWKLRSENQSPAWTTRLDEVPTVRA